MDHVTIAAVEGDTTEMMVYGIEKGTLNTAGETIQNRVAVVGIHAWCYDNLTEAGVAVFKAGMEWVPAESP